MDSSDSASTPTRNAGTQLGALGSVVQAVVSFAALLTIAGSLVLLIEYFTVSTIPLWLAFSESLGGLAWRGWLVLLVVLGPLIAVWLASVDRWAQAKSDSAGWRSFAPKTVNSFVTDQRLARLRGGLEFVLVAVVALVVPFPHVTMAVIVMTLLGHWYRGAARPTPGPSMRALAWRVVLGCVLTVAVLGLAPNGGQSVYVTSAQVAVIRSGWYIKLTDSTDPVYLLTCSRSEVMSVPTSDIALITFGSSGIPSASLLDYLRAWQLPHLGLTPTCPVSQPLQP